MAIQKSLLKCEVTLKPRVLIHQSLLFFNKVEISLIKFKKSKKIESKLLKIEGMSIQLFKNKYGIIPELNTRDDSAGMENFPYNVCI